jgi:hypothetical protein
VPPQGHRGVPGLDGSRHHLGQERLICHVRPGIDDHDPRLITAKFLFQPPRRVETGIAAASHQDGSHVVLYSLALIS